MASERSERARFCFGFGFVLGDYLLSLFERVAERTIIVQARAKWI